MKPTETPPPQTPAEPPPGTGGPNRRLAAEIDAREYRRHRPDLMLLMGCAVIGVLVLVEIVRTHLDTSGAAATADAQRSVAAPAASAATPSPNAATQVMDRVFETALADLKARSASDVEAQRQTVAYRAVLAGTIAKAKLALDIDAFECGPRLCMGSVRGDASAYAALRAALVSASPLPVYAFMDQPAARERADGPHRFMFSIEASAGETGAPAPKP
ncbi:hypothetical protein ABIE09_001396 [Lysobacter enzymogenes]|uniref:hypothetical protein n=1 Tax=Lysobacter enzymogenes TaxID=69 RepID=UPI003399E97E